MSAVRAVSLALALFGFAAPTLGDAGDGALDEAVAIYGAAMNSEERSLRLGAFRRSESLFARAIENGAQNAEVYTNLGNAALQGARLGHAVLAYRRALLLDPDHARALQNLEHARSLLPAWVPHPEGGGVLDSFFFWHRTLSRNERQLSAALCFALAALLAALSIRSGSPTPRNMAVLPALAWCVLLASLALDPATQDSDAAVVTTDEVVARAADSAFAPRLFPAPLPGGVEVRVLERRAPWVRIRLANGRDVWITESSIDPVLP
jgi:tetratricopeptide (TPR) repeat protein